MLKRKRRGREKKGGKRTKEDMIYRGKGHFLLTNTTYSAKGGGGGARLRLADSERLFLSQDTAVQYL